ncbi:MAG TPA: DsbA family oxidoreductase [Polyangiales bacterium]|jgi:predicted DsbA family dithiol-disulfide isomerase|nr:DsbA family oxidoreductase [Polyangiales bacterium]
MASQAPLRIDVWSDVACPWCYLGKRRLESALRDFEHAADTVVTWHAFQLDPSAPAVRDSSLSHHERLAKKYGMSVERARALNDRLCALAEAEGLTFDFEHIRSGNTFDAHRVLRLARERGKQNAVKERLLHAYFCEGQALGDHATLQRLAEEAGLDASEVSELLASDLYAREVREDQAAAQQLAVDGVPFFVIGGRYALAGAQPAELLLKVLREAWNDRPEGEPATAPSH